MTKKNKTSSTNDDSSIPASPTPQTNETALVNEAPLANDVKLTKEISVSPNESAPSPANKNNTPQQAKLESEIKTDSQKTEKSPQIKDKKSKSTALSLLSLALIIASGSGFYYYTNQQFTAYNSQISTLTSEIESLKTDLEVNEAESQTSIKKNKQDMLVLLTQQDNNITSLQSALGEMTGRRPNDWLIAEAEYLVNLSGRQLWLEHDVVTATILMETADLRLAELNDPTLTPIRKAISQDIQQLKSIRRIDVDGIVLRLNSLQQQVQKLPLVNALLPEAQNVVPEKVSSDVNDWKQNLKASFNDFINQFITYRKRDGNAVPLLTAPQTFYLEENLKAKLDQAITAVYRENGALYDEALKVAKEWTLRFFDQEDPLTKSFVATLTLLDNQTIEVSYPQALVSQQLISDLLADRLRRDLAPSPTAESIQ